MKKKKVSLKDVIDIVIYPSWVVLGPTLNTIPAGSMVELNCATNEVRRHIPPPPPLKPLVGVRADKKRKNRK